MNCSNCGEVASDNVNFCRRCGLALGHHDPESTSTITRSIVNNANLVFPQVGSQVVPLSQGDALSSQDTAPGVSTPDNKELIDWARIAAMKKVLLTIAIVAFALLVLNLLSAFFGTEISVTNAPAPSVINQFKMLALILLRLTTVVALPLLPSIVFWRVAHNIYLDLFHESLVRFIMVTMYLIFATASLVILFPEFVISRWLLQVLR